MSGSTLTVTGVMVHTDGVTDFQINNKPAKLSSFHTGMGVRVVGIWNADGSVQAAKLHSPEN